ncbi:MAG: PDZ domain-containing protein [Lewinellaceae bacterium]|nr:PDZ domain-containing protein [Lewinellaceae bacterium]
MYRLSIKQFSLLPVLLLFISANMLAQVTAPTAPTFNFKHTEFSRSNPCKVFIGVGTSTVTEGLKVDYTVDNTPATQYGVLAGDVILTLDGVAVRTQSELLRERNKHQQGDAFTLTILREGVQKTIQARFKECSEAELEAAQEKMESNFAEMEIRMEEMQTRIQEQLKGLEMGERTILGVYENKDVNESGLVISSVVPGKGAEAAGLQAGDIVIQVDGKTVTGGVTLRGALDNHKPGDQVKVVYLRNGQTLETATILSADRHSFTHKVERDPCKVFIGVYTSSHAFEGRGARVDGVIDGTPAKESGVQPGDIIMALNGQAVSSHQEIVGERDKNKPGDAFSLTVLRDGAMIEINAKFKSCETPGDAAVEETVEVLEEDSKSEERDINNSLKLEVLEAYPSPTFGPLNINFEAEAVPTTVRILDVTGKTVYNKELPQFGGFFNEQVNLSNNKAGNYVLSIQQGKKVFTKQVVLLPRA